MHPVATREKTRDQQNTALQTTYRKQKVKQVVCYVYIKQRVMVAICFHVSLGNLGFISSCFWDANSFRTLWIGIPLANLCYIRDMGYLSKNFSTFLSEVSSMYAVLPNVLATKRTSQPK